MIEWFNLYLEVAHEQKIKDKSELSFNALLIANIAHEIAYKQKTSYPNWMQVEKKSGLSNDDFMKAFSELENVQLVSSSFPSILTSICYRWPLPPIFGPLTNLRPPKKIWEEIRKRIFERDSFTCRYCYKRGVRLECDHVIPVSRGGGSDDDNLVTACFQCNRSKRDKLLNEWLNEMA